MVRCKFKCTHVDHVFSEVVLNPLYTGSEENKAFFKATPSGEIKFQTVNPAALKHFTQGQAYYVDFTPAPE